MDILPITAEYLRGLKAAKERQAHMACVQRHVVRIMENVTAWANQGTTWYKEELDPHKGWPVYDRPNYRITLDDVLVLLKKSIIGAKIEYQGNLLVIDWS
jgi:hypothetical protein